MFFDDINAKREFALRLSKGESAISIASDLSNGNKIKFIEISNKWPSDRIVVDYLNEFGLIDNSKDDDLEPDLNQEQVFGLIKNKLIKILNYAEKDADAISAAKELKLLMNIGTEEKSEGLYNYGAIILPETLDPDEWQMMVNEYEN